MSPNANSLPTVRIEQARQLQGSTLSSCLIVEAVIIFVALVMFTYGQPELAIDWFAITTGMVLITYVYAGLPGWSEITESNYAGFLRGHIFITTLTGCVWSAFAITQIEPDSVLSLYIAVTITISITLGGLFPSSAYRPSYVGLVTFCILPLAAYWLLVVPHPQKYQGLGLIIYYIFAMIVSARTELSMRDMLMAKKEKLHNDELQLRNERIQQINEDKTQFMLATVHDFSQPLQAQAYFIHSLRQQLFNHGDLELLDKIESSWRSQKELLDAMSEVARLEGTLVEPRLTRVDLASILGEVSAEFEGEADQKHINFERRFNSALTETDPALFARVIRNLLMNAFKFTENYQTVVLQNYRIGNQAIIKIRDKGIGIPAKDQERIFNEYIQLNNPSRDREQGLGLGLSIVRRLSEALDVDIQLESEPGEGTIFTLKIACEASAELTTDSRENTPGKTVFDSHPLVVLVDDEQEIRDGMSSLLTSWGCEVIAAESGIEARKKLASSTRPPSLLLIDNRLKDSESGIQLIDKIRDDVNQGTAAILITGDVASLSELNSKLEIELLRKPVPPEELRAQVSQSLAMGA